MAYIGTIPAEAYTSFAVQHFTTSATDTFTLDFPVANENEIALFINNVRQEPGSSYAYTASGTTLTLSSAITGSDSMYCVFIGKAVQTVTPAVGSVTNDMLAGSIATSKLADGSTFATTNGITMADQWRLTTSLSLTSSGFTNITANLERVDTDGYASIGTGMTESSGTFSFPSTGIYLIRFNAGFQRTAGATRYIGMQLMTTTDNSTYDAAAQMYEQLRDDTSTNGAVSNEFIFDVTNTTTHKVKFRIDTSNSNTAAVQGNSSYNWTCFTFIRLGDT